MSSLNPTELPAWNNDSEYPGLDSAIFLSDLEKFKQRLLEIRELNRKWPTADLTDADTDADADASVKLAQTLSPIFEKTRILSRNLRVFVDCLLSVNSKDDVAQKVNSVILKLNSELRVLATSCEQFLMRADESTLEKYLDSPATTNERFYWNHARKRKDLLLDGDQERLLAQFRQFGIDAWSDLYDRISGSLKVSLPDQDEVGLAQAAGMLRDPNSLIRKNAWEGIQKAWSPYQESVAAILNTLSGYRLEEYQQRSKKRKIDFLEMPLLDSKIERQTLDAMFSAIESRADLVERSVQLTARLLNKEKLEPWDHLAPAHLNSGSAKTYTFQEASQMIHQAFSEIDPNMGKFVFEMIENGWIEARVLPNKISGAHCTGFAKSRTPRVFQTFMGSYKDVSTLAHELGHAWHSWTMRDLPDCQLNYPMTLAETASIFAETALADHIFKNGSENERFQVAYENVSHAVSLLANIPARFEFEKNLYQARQTNTVSAQDLSDMMSKAFIKYYGNHITEPESLYWMTKLHFSIGSVSFYNFPYTFGYLFSLGIYSLKENGDANFTQTYREILRDTGRMTAEDLIQKHLGEDIRSPKFWLRSLSEVEKKVDQLESLRLPS